MSKTRKRRPLTVGEKLRILKETQQPCVQIADLCRQHGISTSQFYGCSETARQGAMAALSQPPGRKGQSNAQAQLERLQAERDPLRAVIAEITAENRELRKSG